MRLRVVSSAQIRGRWASYSSIVHFVHICSHGVDENGAKRSSTHFWLRTRDARISALKNGGRHVPKSHELKWPYKLPTSWHKWALVCLLYNRSNTCIVVWRMWLAKCKTCPSECAQWVMVHGAPHSCMCFLNACHCYMLHVSSTMHCPSQLQTFQTSQNATYLLLCNGWCPHNKLARRPKRD